MGRSELTASGWVLRAGAPRRGLPERCMGRSRGGLTAKIHAAANAAGLPIRYDPSPGHGLEQVARVGLAFQRRQQQCKGFGAS